MNYATLTAVPAVAVSVFGAGTVSGAQVYRWVDGNGTIHFSDKSPSEQGARDLQIKSHEGSANVSVVPGQAAKSGPTVKILSTIRCGVCKKAKTYLSEKGVTFREYDAVSYTHLTLPTIYSV